MSRSYWLWTVTIQLLTTLSRLRHTVLRVLSHCGLLCLAKRQSYSFLLYPKLCLSGVRVQKLESTSLPVWNENIIYHINKQKMSQPSAISGLQMWLRAPQTVIQQLMPSPPQWLLRSWWNEYRKQGDQETGLAPDSWGACERSEFQSAQRLASSHTQNAKFLNVIPGLWCSGEGNGTPLQYSWPGKSHGRRSLVGCSLWGR